MTLRQFISSTSGKPPSEERSELGQAVMLGMNCAVGMAVFTFAGYWVDQKRGGGLLFTLIGMTLGLGYGAYEVWKVVRQIQRKDAERKIGKDTDGQKRSA